MPEESYQVVAGLVIAIIVLLIAAAFILILVAYSNRRKKRFYEEKQRLQRSFNEQLLQSQLEIQEQTFNSISTEIHDNVGQMLSLAKVQVNILEQTKNLDSGILFDLKENIGKAMLDLRDIAKGLNSDRIQSNTLSELTQLELQRMARLGIIKTSLKNDGEERTPTPQKKLIIFRIIQESLNNVLKHASAKNVDVIFQYLPEHLICCIKDDGGGFNTNHNESKEGLGLRNMARRAELIEAELLVESTLGKGTTTTIKSFYD